MTLLTILCHEFSHIQSYWWQVLIPSGSGECGNYSVCSVIMAHCTVIDFMVPVCGKLDSVKVRWNSVNVWAIIQVKGHQHWWLAGAYDLEIWHSFLEVASMVVSWWMMAFLRSEGPPWHYEIEHCLKGRMPQNKRQLTLTVLVATIDAQWEGMGDVGSARYEPALLPPCPTIRVLNYSN